MKYDYSIAWSIPTGATRAESYPCVKPTTGRNRIMRIKTKSGRWIQLNTDEEEAAINAGIAADPGTCELTDEEFRQLRPVGRPKAEETKERITIRLSPEVVNYFRGTGRGWQTRMDEALQEYVANHS